MTGFSYDTLGPWIAKDPDAVTDYGIDWADWLAESTDPTDTLLTSAWSSDAGITTSAPQLDGTVASCLISGGSAGTTYTVTNRITTTNGRTEDRSFRVKVAER